VNRVVQAILQGKKRVLITMATGTGKTEVAFQICWKLWSSRWNRKGEPHRKPKILFLADRNFLVDDPKDKTFAAFGDARFKIENGQVNLGREMYFAIYQAIARDERRRTVPGSCPASVSPNHTYPLCSISPETVVVALYARFLSSIVGW
jgi:type I restriction enzyme R subunit